MSLTRILTAALLLPILLGCSSNASRDINEQRALVNSAAATVSRLVSDPQLPELRKYIKNAKAVLIIPNMYRAGFVIGGEYGRGVLIVKNSSASAAASTAVTAPTGGIETEDLQSGTRTQSGRMGVLTEPTAPTPAADGWGNPLFYRLTGGSVGLQIGGQAAEIVITIMTDKGLQRLMNNSIKLGADISVAVGPVGQNVAAGTAVRPGKADMYTFGQTAGLYGGLSLSGAVLNEDAVSNVLIYGNMNKPEEILAKSDGPLVETKNLRTALGQ